MVDFLTCNHSLVPSKGTAQAALCDGAVGKVSPKKPDRLGEGRDTRKGR